MSKFELGNGELLVIHLPSFEEFQRLHADIASGLLDCVESVNSRYIERGEISRLMLVPA